MKDATVIRFGHQMFHDKKIDSATFAKAVELWGQARVDGHGGRHEHAVSGYFAIDIDEHSLDSKSELPLVK